jgi:hypothetical protein
VQCLRVLAFIPMMVFIATAVSWAGEHMKVHPSEAYSAEVAIDWFEMLYDVIKAERVGPPPASRMYGIAAVALYEAVTAGSTGYRSLAGQLNELVSVPPPQAYRAYHWPTVANAALARTMRSLFAKGSPDSQAAIETLEARFAEQFRGRVRPLVYARSVAYGQEVADAILLWAAGDGFAFHNDCPYTPPAGPGLWVPTPPDYTVSPAQPCWGQLRPFVLTSGAECALPPHPTYAEDAESAFYAHAFSVYRTSLTLTDEQRTIARYWADTSGDTGTPPGHWIAIMGQLATQDGLSLMAAAEGYARVGIAVADAFISCWDTKYTYNLLRPVTYIQQVIDATWLPLIPTPPFPEYASGHSTQSMAAASQLTALFGVRTFTDTTHLDHGLALEPRTFTSFEEAALEAAMSRLYGGIHYPFGNEAGLGQGECVGKAMAQRLQFRR